MTDNKMKEISDLLASHKLRKRLEENDREILDRGYTVGARVKCKSGSFFDAKGFIVSIHDSEMLLHWEDEKGKSLDSFLPIKASLFDGSWFVLTTSGMEDLKLWGTW